MNGVETRAGLVQNVDVISLVENDNVIQPVIVHIDESNGSPAVVGAVEQFSVEVESLGRQKSTAQKQC